MHGDIKKGKMMMKLACVLLLFMSYYASATFSIIAYDSDRDEYGAALSSCVKLPVNVDVSNLLNSITDKGAVTTQGQVNVLENINLKNATMMIEQGVHGYQILEWLYHNDQDEDPAHRQTLLLSKTDTVAEGYVYTGPYTPSEREDYTENGLVIAGNSIDAGVIQKMKEGFKNSDKSTLAAKLMDSLIAVRDSKLGDNRCKSLGVSSTMAFLKVGNNFSIHYNSQGNEDAITGLEEVLHCVFEDIASESVEESNGSG